MSSSDRFVSDRVLQETRDQEFIARGKGKGVVSNPAYDRQANFVETVAAQEVQERRDEDFVERGKGKGLGPSPAQHALRAQPSSARFCNVCRSQGTAYRCLMACDYDICTTCYQRGHTTHPLPGHPGPERRDLEESNPSKTSAIATSEEEAATKIQSNIRGFLARKELSGTYGAPSTSSADALDSAQQRQVILTHQWDELEAALNTQLAQMKTELKAITEKLERVELDGKSNKNGPQPIRNDADRLPLLQLRLDLSQAVESSQAKLKEITDVRAKQNDGLKVSYDRLQTEVQELKSQLDVLSRSSTSATKGSAESTPAAQSATKISPRLIRGGGREAEVLPSPSKYQYRLTGMELVAKSPNSSAASTPRSGFLRQGSAKTVSHMPAEDQPQHCEVMDDLDGILEQEIKQYRPAKLRNSTAASTLMIV